LRELLAGFERAERAGKAAGGAVLGDVRNNPRHRQEIYLGLVTVLMRMVFVLYAEPRGLLPRESDLYSLARLHAQLLEDCKATGTGGKTGASALDNRCGAWACVITLFRVLYDTKKGALFNPATYPFLDARPHVSDGVVFRVLDHLLVPNGERLEYESVDVEQIGDVYEGLMGFELRVTQGESLHLQPSEERRKTGSHYTPRSLTQLVVQTTLRPILDALGPQPTPGQILALKICDPAMGSGAFLVETCRQLGDHLVAAWHREQPPMRNENPDRFQVDARSRRPARSGPEQPASALRTAPQPPTKRSRQIESGLARCMIAQRCIYGVDKNELAVSLARLSLWLVAFAKDHSFTFVDHALRQGDSLIAFHWEIEFPEVFDHGNGAGYTSGFHAFVGNPPWVSYAGRAAQPLDEAKRAYFKEFYESFGGYRNLQGMFVERCAKLLRASGRLGLILPSSMSEQDGYSPTRLVHDRLCVCDDDLPDLGEKAFAGVFQPCMLLRSTRRASPVTINVAACWPIERPDLDAASRALMAKMNRPPLPECLFGERGLQSSRDDTGHLTTARNAIHSVPLRVGGDIEPFLLKPPSQFADPAWFGTRLRSAGQWAEVRVLIRQTARFPIATLSDGTAFRNSILAGFASIDYPAEFLVAYLNSTPIRWLHYVRYRDARQGMPQMKIGHLRAMPSPPAGSLVADLARMGRALSSANVGLLPSAHNAIDDAVARAFNLTKRERALLKAWAKATR